MHLKSIELQGFKSFADKTRLELTPGVTAVVGPNGSGKSNIADAIRWVMGEKSMKTLRGKRTEDIIFAGSKDKGRSGMAEISLHLDNQDKKLPLDYTDVVLTRRIYRSGDSEYLINKSRARLLDIQSLLARAGFGQKTYSIIGQGMIERIVQSGPKEKKELFEEAAGIKQYQIKKQVSLNKLNLTKQNLISIAGLLEEILPRLRSLKRQANKVYKKEKLEKELKEIAQVYLNFFYNSYTSKLKELKEEAIKREKSERFLEADLGNIKEKLGLLENKSGSDEVSKHEEQLGILKEKRNKLEQEISLVDGRVQLAKEQKSSNNLQDLYQQKERVGGRIFDLESSLLDLREKVESLNLGLKQNQNKQTEFNSEIQKAQEKLQEEQKKLVKPNLTMQSLLGELEEIYKAQENIIEKIENTKEISGLEALKKEIRNQKENFEKLLSNIKNEVQHDGQEIESEELKAVQAEIERLAKEKSVVDQEMSDLKIKQARISAESGFKQEELSKAREEDGFLDKKIKFQESKEKQASKNPAIDKLLAEKEEFGQELAKLNEKIEKIERTLSSFVSAQEEEKNKIFDLEKKYRTIQEELNKTRDQRAESEIQKARFSDQKDSVENEIKEVFGEDQYSEFIENTEKNPCQALENEVKCLRSDIDNIKNKLIQIGEPDMEALKEYEDCQTRYTFLSEQKEDLENAIISLRKIVEDLNKVMSGKFEKSFKNINEHFQRYFEILFEGGRAKLFKKKLESSNEEGEEVVENLAQKEKDDYINTAIEIKANPPGKKLTSLSMLSGGEKALTAIALILAIIENNPSPFIVLDEVDASLDEANSERYADILTSVASKSQFIAITHNRETMKMANSIYGVTMEKSGITKLLSVKLDEIPAA